MRKGLAAAGGAVAVLSGAVVALAVGEPQDGARPVVPETVFQRTAFPAAAREALGRRVLFLEADPGKARRAVILESGRDAGGWALFPGAPAASPSFARHLDRLAAAAGAAWDRDRGFPPDVDRALDLCAVKVVLVDDAGKGARRIVVRENAEPVLRLDGPAPADADPVAFAAACRTTPSRDSAGWTHADWDDRLWGGSVTVTTARPARFLLPAPAEGAKVETGGAPAAPVAAGPFVAVDLPAGTTRVGLSYVERGPAPALAIAGAAGLVAGLLVLLLAIRPSRADVEASAARR